MLHPVVGVFIGVSSLALVFVCAVTLAIYLLPTIVGYFRKVEGLPYIFLLNLLLGWSGIMWFICLAWAFLGPQWHTYIRFRRG
jgi:Superinfection immunity protein